MFLPLRHNQRGKCPFLPLSSGEKGGLGNRGRSKAAWLTVPLGNGPRSQSFLLRLWVTKGMGWGEEAGTPPSPGRPRQTNKQGRMEAASFPSLSCQLYWQWPTVLGVVMEWGLKPLLEAQLIVRMSTAPGWWSQYQDYRMSSFKAGSFVKHSKKCFSDYSLRP